MAVYFKGKLISSNFGENAPTTISYSGGSSSSSSTTTSLIPSGPGVGTLTIIDRNTGKIIRQGTPSTGTGLPSIAPPTQEQVNEFYENQKPDLTQKIDERVLAQELNKPVQIISQGFMQIGKVDNKVFVTAKNALKKPLAERSYDDQVAIIQAAGMSEGYNQAVVKKQELKNIVAGGLQRNNQFFLEKSLNQQDFISAARIEQRNMILKKPLNVGYTQGRQIAEVVGSIPGQVYSGVKETLIDAPAALGKRAGKRSKNVFEVPGNIVKEIGKSGLATATLIVTQPDKVLLGTFDSFMKAPAKFVASTGINLLAFKGAGSIIGKGISPIKVKLLGKTVSSEGQLIGTSKIRGITIDNVQQSLVNVKGMLNVVVKEKGTGFLNKGKVYSTTKIYEPIKIKSVVGIENISEAGLKTRIVSSATKFAEKNLGKIKASDPLQLEKLSDILAKDLASVKGQINLGYPKTSRLYGGSRFSVINEKSYIQPKSGKIVQEFEAQLPKSEILRINLGKTITKNTGVSDFSKTFTRFKTFEKTTSEGSLISSSGKFLTKDVGVSKGIPLKVDLSGKYYVGGMKRVSAKIDSKINVVSPSGFKPSMSLNDLFKDKTVSSVSPSINLVESASSGGQKLLLAQKIVSSDKVVVGAKSISVPKVSVASSKAISRSVTGLLDSKTNFSAFAKSKSKFRSPYEVVAFDYGVEESYVPSVEVGVVPKQSISFSEKSFVVPRVKLIDSVKYVEGVKSVVETKPRIVVRPSVRTSNVTSVIERTDVIPKEVISTKTKIVTPTKQITLIKTIPRITTRITTFPVFKIPVVPKIPVIGRVREKTFFKSKSFGFSKGAFSVVSRVGGKKVTLAVGVPRNIALAIGKRFTSGTTARSFKIKQIGLTNKSDIGGQDLFQYRSPKFSGRVAREGFTFVEKSKFAIDTPGEIKGLKEGKITQKSKYDKFLLPKLKFDVLSNTSKKELDTLKKFKSRLSG